MLHRPWFHHQPRFHLPYCLSLPMPSDAMKAASDRGPADWPALARLYPSCLQMSLDNSFETEAHCKSADLSGAGPKGMCQPPIAQPSGSVCRSSIQCNGRDSVCELQAYMFGKTVRATLAG